MNVEYVHQGIVFEWDSEKAAANLVKHGVSFETACQAFFDPFVKVADDQTVDTEIRETIMGMTRQWKLLCVIYTIRIDDRFRIISARPATQTERRDYEGQ